MQAPKRRSTPAAAPDPAGRRRLLLAGLAALAVLALVAVLGVIFFAGGSESEAAVLRDEGCTLESFPALEGSHDDDPDAKPKYNSNPPTSGPHRSTPAVYGFYSEPVEQMQAVHNLEHGAVVIQFGKDVPQAEIDRLRAFYESDPNGLLVAQLPELDDKITLSAWTAPENVGEGSSSGRGYLATCTSFSKRAFEKFISEHRYKGPERFPADSLVPGHT